MICAKFDWNWPAGSEEENFKKFSVYFCDYLPLEKGNALHFNNLKSPPPKDDLCKVWLKLAQRFWRRSRKCKSLQTDGQTDRRTDRRTTDKRRSEKLTWAFSSGELITMKVRHLTPFCVLRAIRDEYAETASIRHHLYHGNSWISQESNHSHTFASPSRSVLMTTIS